MTNQDALKEAAAREAVREVKSGQVLGLGTGSTAKFVVIALGEKLRSGELSGLVGIPTSEETRALAVAHGVPLAPLDAHAVIDLAIDGADEIDPHLDLVKGLGGALLREKQVELRARRFLVVADASKLVPKIGTKAPIPVEVPRDRWRDFVEPLRALGATPVLRGGEAKPLVTDNGNHVLDARFPGGLDDPRAIAAALDRLGVLAHGLFLDMADEAIIAEAGGVRRVPRPRAKQG